MFAYAVWAKTPGECIIDVYPSINFGDQKPVGTGPMMDEFSVRGFRYLEYMSQPTPNYELAHYRTLVGASSAILLGSSGGCHFNEESGEYFEVGYENLTEKGLTRHRDT